MQIDGGVPPSNGWDASEFGCRERKELGSSLTDYRQLNTENS